MPELPCDSQCRYQKDGKCTLERAEWVRSNDGADCMSHLFEKEDTLHC